MKYYEEGATPVSFAQMREAYLKLGLQVEELPISYGSSPVKLVHDGVPYLLDCYQDLDDISTCATKFYILAERHHETIKRLYDAWKPQVTDELLVMSGGGLQLQAFFMTHKKGYLGILYLSHIDDGRFAALKAELHALNVPFKPYQPVSFDAGATYTILLGQPWLSTLPDVAQVQFRCQSTHKNREPKTTSPK